jgi:hypothetical protein
MESRLAGVGRDWKMRFAALCILTMVTLGLPQSDPVDQTADEETLVQLIDQGPEAVIEYLEGFESGQRLDLFQLVRELYVFRSFEGQNLDDLVTVSDWAIEEALEQARNSEVTLVRMELLDIANTISWNLSADLAACWPGDTLTRTSTHFERGLGAALQSIVWRYELDKDDYSLFLAYWAAGMHQLSLNRPEEAIYNFVKSMNHAEQYTVDQGRPLGISPQAGFELLLAHGYFGLAEIMADGDTQHYDLVMSKLGEGLSDPEFSEDYQFAIDQLEWARTQLGI